MICEDQKGEDLPERPRSADTFTESSNGTRIETVATTLQFFGNGLHVDKSFERILWKEPFPFWVTGNLLEDAEELMLESSLLVIVLNRDGSCWFDVLTFGSDFRAMGTETHGVDPFVEGDR